MNGYDIRLQALLSDYEEASGDGGSKVERIYNAFLKTIETGYWRPGDQLPTEKQMAVALPVSEGTVQAAMRRLVSTGIVQRSRGRGSFVSKVDEGDNMFLRFLVDEFPTPSATETLHITVDKVDKLQKAADE